MNDLKPIPVKPVIKFEDLEKVEDIKKSDKLVKLTVDFGDFKRTILVGMKQARENPQELEIKQALFVVNLEPRKMMGEISEGMVFDIGYSNGIIPVLAVPETPVQDGVQAG